MKFSFFTCGKKEEAWFFPAVLTAGLVIGFASIALVSQFLPGERAMKAQQTQIQATAPGGGEQEAVSSTEQIAEPRFVNLGEIHAAWTEREELSRQRVQELIMGATTNTEFAARALASSDSENRGCDSVVKNIWSIGKIADGEWGSSTIYYAGIEGTCGMGDLYTTYNLLIGREEDGKEKLYKVVENTEGYGYACDPSSLDPIYCIIGYAGGEFTNLKTPAALKLQNGKQLVFLSGDDVLISQAIQSEMKVVAKAKTGEVIYARPDLPPTHPFDIHMSSVGILDPIGRFQEYGSFIDADGYADSTSTHSDKSVTIDDFKWVLSIGEKISASEKVKNYVAADYTSMIQDGGCGGGGTNYVDVNKESIEQIGTYGNGDPVYIPKDYVNDAQTKSVFDKWLAMSGEKKTMDDFFRLNPVPYFFWQDAFGDWIQYTSTAVVPLAECGKPVIYLYPTTTTNVTVKLPKFIHVTVSDPAYPVNGWSVIASSSGMLISKDDGKIYDSLYWEGTGVSYKAPKTGFVIKGSDAASFLQTTLPKYGLNPKETFDFMEFWVPKLQAVPYAQVSFLTDVWSKAAPLSVSPRPQTSIRIFMDWKPLSAPISITAPNIVTPVRNGFTLVEWGGTLYK